MFTACALYLARAFELLLYGARRTETRLVNKQALHYLLALRSNRRTECEVFIILDGDDVGRLITRAYITNNVRDLAEVADSVNHAVSSISDYLTGQGFVVHFCAADGVVAETNSNREMAALFASIQTFIPNGITFSAGSGASLQKAYLALSYAKAAGKNAHCSWDSMPIDRDSTA